MPSALSHLTGQAAWAGLAVLILAYTIGVVYVHDAVRPAPEGPAPKPDTVRVNDPLMTGDLVGPAIPDKVATYQTPDSADTRKECFQMPSWLASTQESHAPDSEIQASTSDSLKTYELRQSRTVELTDLGQKWGGPSYAITPLTSGSPRLSVGSDQVVFSGYLPNGQGRKWTYKVPKPDWRLMSRSVGTATTSHVSAQTAITVERRTRIGWLGVGPAASAVVTAGGASGGFGATITLNTTLWTDS